MIYGKLIHRRNRGANLLSDGEKKHGKATQSVNDVKLFRHMRELLCVTATRMDNLPT